MLHRGQPEPSERYCNTRDPGHGYFRHVQTSKGRLVPGQLNSCNIPSSTVQLLLGEISNADSPLTVLGTGFSP